MDELKAINQQCKELGRGNDDIRWQTCYRGSKQTQNNIHKTQRRCRPFQLRGKTLHISKWRNRLHFSYDAVRRSLQIPSKPYIFQIWYGIRFNPIQAQQNNIKFHQQGTIRKSSKKAGLCRLLKAYSKNKTSSIHKSS